MMRVAYETNLGICYRSTIEDALSTSEFKKLHGKVNLILTSPPFPLTRKKSYGNRNGQKYVSWLSILAVQLRSLLAPKGSVVLEIGNAWESGKPLMSTTPLKSLLGFLEFGEYHLCQQFVWYNNARLPSPAQWVNVKRIRVKDAFTQFWWMSKVPNPHANNRKVLIDYSLSMKRLLRDQKYNAGLRPSEHLIGKKSFLKTNKGAIPSNVFIGANTNSSSAYRTYCRAHGLPLHPARMPSAIAEFFIMLLTKPGDVILDPFGGSNTTGAAAEKLGRKWITLEPNIVFVRGSKGRFKGLIR
jgi:site-specific DNA-methyltransferase (cytosine-N4-specific)